MNAFDRLFAEAVPLIKQGLHQWDTPPAEGGRWPVSVVLRPNQTSADRLEQEMTEVEALAGPGHFRTGSAGSLHVTVRALEGYREAAAKHDKVVQRYALAMSRAARQVEAIQLELVGMTLTPGSVMVCAHPVDDSADRFMDELTDQLGADAWYSTTRTALTDGSCFQRSWPRLGWAAGDRPPQWPADRPFTGEVPRRLWVAQSHIS